MRWRVVLALLSVGGEAVAIAGWVGVLGGYSSRLSIQAQMAIGNTPGPHLFWGVVGVLSLVGLFVAIAGLPRRHASSKEDAPSGRFPRRSWARSRGRGQNYHSIDFS